MLVVLVDQFDLILSASGVDLFNGNLGTAAGGNTVQGGGAGQRSDVGDLQGNGLLREGGADSQRQDHSQRQSDKLFHFVILLV